MTDTPKPEWQPIETAPKDGSYCLVTRFVRHGIKDDIWVMHVAWYDERDDGWHILNMQNHIVPPTHWMPLPEPPK